MRCETCDREVVRPATGRPRRFCSDACRQAAYRRRRHTPQASPQHTRDAGECLRLFRAIRALENADRRSPAEAETARRLAQKLTDQLEARLSAAAGGSPPEGSRRATRSPFGG